MATPVSGPTTITSATPGTAVTAIAANMAGGYITNPTNASDQGLSAPEPLYIDQVHNATLSGNGSTIVLQPGQSYSIIPFTITPVTAVAASPNHKFTAVQWPTS
jgi:hypothetical protein